MNRLGELIHENDFGYKVYAVSMRDKATSRISVEVYIVSPEDEITVPMTIQKKDISGKAKWADIFWGLEADFSRDDIDKIKLGILKFIGKATSIDSPSRVTPNELYMALSNHIRRYRTGTTGDMFIKDGHGFINRDALEKFIKHTLDATYKRLEVLKILRIMGVLECSKDGHYDILVSINGEKKRFHKILLAEEVHVIRRIIWRRFRHFIWMCFRVQIV